jgi:hypothetical protein
MLINTNSARELRETKQLLTARLSPIEVRSPILIAVIDYWQEVGERRGLFQLITTSLEERVNDLNYITEQYKSSQSDEQFINNISNYISTKDNSSSLKQRVTQALDTARVALQTKRDMEKNIEQFTKFAVLTLCVTAPTGPENLVLAAVVLVAALLIYYHQKSQPYASAHSAPAARPGYR